MGQAFDRDGNVLGDAYGETKAEVFDTLNQQFKDAFEIRVRTLEHDQQLLLSEKEKPVTVLPDGTVIEEK